MDCSNCSRYDQVVDDFAVDFSDHFVGHEVGQGAFGVHVVNALEILSGFEGPGGFQLAGHGGHRI